MSFPVYYIFYCAILIFSFAEKGQVYAKEARVLAGRASYPYARPYIVRIFTHSNKSYSGVLINAYTVLSIAIPPETVLKVVAGKYLRESYETTQQTRFVCTSASHPKLSSDGYQYNYGIYQLSDPFVLNEYVNAIALAAKGSVHKGECRAAGWGPTKPNGGVTNRMHEAVVSFADKKDCKHNHETNICVLPIGKFDEDAGAPVICDEDAKIYVYGFFSAVDPKVANAPPAPITFNYLSSVPNIDTAWIISEMRRAEKECGSSYR